MTGLKRLAESQDDSSTSETVATPSEFMVVRNAWVVSRHVRVWVCLEMVYYASYSHSKWHHVSMIPVVCMCLWTIALAIQTSYYWLAETFRVETLVWLLEICICFHLRIYNWHMPVSNP